KKKKKVGGLGIKKKATKKIKEKKKGSKEKNESKKKIKRKIGIETKGIRDFLKYLGKKEYFEIYKIISSWDESFFKKGFSRNFENKKKMNSFFKERVLDFLKSHYTDLKSEISHLRKKGEEVDYIDFEVLQIPLKIKLFSAYFSLDDFLKIKKIVDFARTEFKKFKLDE
ncbi:MAG TPA: hypothetical protein VJ895_02595, partial [Candidatus Nanoarchaeia archaeon]|nr:hypothetical protein [Candidatus Nanoarchaeia archaeon]